MSALSIIVPMLDEQPTIAEALLRLSALRERGAEIIVVDGGSVDASVDAARPYADHVLRAPRGRGAQMNAGARAALGNVLFFLHADTRLPPGSDALISEALQRSDRCWGRFDVAIEGRSALLPLIAAMMNVRSRLSGIATGDQAIFVRRAAFAQAGGFPDIALMEDIAFSRRLKRISRPLCLSAQVITSGRRWDKYGAVRTVLMMWGLRLAYYLGADTGALAQRYGYVPRQS